MHKIIFICTLALVFCACSTNDEPESPEKPVTTVYSITAKQFEEQIKGRIWESDNNATKYFDGNDQEHFLTDT